MEGNNSPAINLHSFATLLKQLQRKIFRSFFRCCLRSVAILRLSLVLKVMNLVVYGVEMSDVVMGALNFRQCGRGSIPGLDVILGWGLLGLFSAP